MSATRTRWAAIGAAVAVAVGFGSVQLVNAAIDDGERTVLVPTEPCRLVDTRPSSQVGTTSTLQEDAAVVIDVHGEQGECDIPDTASGVSLNVTAVDPSNQTNIRIYPTPDDDSVPLTANLNPFPGLPQEFNSVITDLNDEGQFSVYNRFGTVDVVIDLVGFYADHTHDDRYYTEDEIDAVFPLIVFETADADTTGLTTAAAILTAEVTAPSAGAIFAESVVTVTNGGAAAVVSCSISLDVAMDTESTQTQTMAANAVDDLSAMTVYLVDADETVEVSLVCESDQAVDLSNPQLMVTFNADLALATTEPTVPTTAPSSSTTSTIAAG